MVCLHCCKSSFLLNLLVGMGNRLYLQTSWGNSFFGQMTWNFACKLHFENSKDLKPSLRADKSARVQIQYLQTSIEVNLGYQDLRKSKSWYWGKVFIFKILCDFGYQYKISDFYLKIWVTPGRNKNFCPLLWTSFSIPLIWVSSRLETCSKYKIYTK